MSGVLVTGATGLVGGNVCRLLIESGVAVSGLVRNLDDAQPLADLGVDLRLGDVLDADSVQAAATGQDVIIHAAAVLGGTNQSADEQAAVNAGGSAVVFDVAEALGQRVVLFSTIVVFDPAETLTEHSRLDPDPTDSYTRSKLTAYRDAMRRVEVGADIVAVIPGSVFGPSPMLSRAMAPTSFNRLIRGALNGRLVSYPDMQAVWVRAEDVAAVAVRAAERGQAGERFLGVGIEDAIDSREFYNLACDLAGVKHRVQRLDIDPADPVALATYGESMVRSIGRQRPTPAVDAAHTRQRLGISPASVRDALIETVAWMRDNDQIRVPG